MQPNHDHIKDTLIAMIESVGIKYSLYADEERESTYHSIDGKTIKLWNVYPVSGERLDRLMVAANEFLRPYNLFLAQHVFAPPVNRLIPVIVPQKRGPDVRCRAYAEVPQYTMSLLVKPLPEPINVCTIPCDQ